MNSLGPVPCEFRWRTALWSLFLPYLCPKDEDFCGFLVNMYSTTDWESFSELRISNRWQSSRCHPRKYPINDVAAILYLLCGFREIGEKSVDSRREYG